jgi:hypothetical protein
MIASDDSEGLTARAEGFLRTESVKLTMSYDLTEDRSDAEAMAACFSISVDEILTNLNDVRSKFGGLQYRSHSWSFDEVITFSPYLDFDEEDSEPMISLIEHTVAHPFGVWTNLTGGVFFMYPGPENADYVQVFSRVESVIESDSLHYECANWHEVAQGGISSLTAIEEKATLLEPIDEASGYTESWWRGEGFRLFIWKTWAQLFERESNGKWAIYASSLKGREAALKFVNGIVD